MSSLDSDWPIHDRIVEIQSSVLTMLMNPDTLQHVYDNELRTPADKDMLTLPELLDKIESAIWSEVDAAPADKFTARKPWISSLRRNLQREYVERLIDLTLPTSSSSAAHMPISNLATMKLRNLNERIGKLVDGDAAANIDPYSLAHLSEAKMRIEKALDAQFIYNVNDISGGAGNVILRLGEEPQSN
ncbi:MAG: zinc-dependent metalloprotease [Pirellulaceae bacterium]